MKTPSMPSSRTRSLLLSGSGFATLSVFLLTGTVRSEGETLAPYPFSKGQFDGQLEVTASQNTGATAIAARTFVITEELQNHLGQFQIDLVATLDDSGGGIFPDTVYASNILTASFYVSSSVAQFYAGPPSSLSELFRLHTSTFVDAFGNHLQTYPVPKGNQFLSTIDLGSGQGGNTNLAFSTLTNESQSLLFRTWINSLQVGDVAVIGISFDAIAENGLMRITSTTHDLGNDLVAFGTVLPPISLGFYVTPVPELLAFPKVTCTLTSTTANLAFANLVPTQEYRIMRSLTLSSWEEAHLFTATGNTSSWSEALAPEGQRFYKLEWNK